MIGPTFTITQIGVEPISFLFALDDAITVEGQKAMHKFAADTAEKARWYAPKKSLELVTSIRAEGPAVIVGARHGQYMEYGTSRITNGRVYPGDRYKSFAFVRPALDELRGGKGTSIVAHMIKKKMSSQNFNAVIIYGAFGLVGGIGGAVPVRRATKTAIPQRQFASYNKWRQESVAGLNTSFMDHIYL